MNPMEDTDTDSLVRQVMIVSAQLENELTRCIRVCVALNRGDVPAPALNMLSFKQRLDALRLIITQVYDTQHPARIEFARWRKQLHGIRRTRNFLLHKILGRSFGSIDVDDLRVARERIKTECEAAAQWAVRLGEADT
jgi:hypothetical protein